MKKELRTAIVASFTNYGEKDRIVRLISQDHGKISIMAKNARSPKGKNAGVFDIGNQLQISVSAPKQGDIWKLHEVELQEGFGQIHKDIQKLAIMIYCCEVIDHLSLTEEPSPRLYGLLENSLKLLEKIPTPQNSFHIAFASKALSFAGLQPNLKTCIHCSKPISAPILYQPVLGGVIHQQCNQELSKGLKYKSLPSSHSSLGELEHLLYTPIADTHTLSIKNGENWAMARSVEEQTERPLQSKSFLQSLYP